MLIYKNDGKLFCISKKALKLAGYHDIEHFNDEHNDYSELFVKRPGYIYNFENFSWLTFLRNANEEQKRVLISTKDNATYECELAMETIYPVEFDENTPEFFYQIEFKNLRLADGSRINEDFEEATPDEIAFEEKIVEPTYTKESAADTFAARDSEERKHFLEKAEKKEELQFDTTFEEPQTPILTMEPADKPLDMVDFEFGSTETKSEEEPLFSSPAGNVAVEEEALQTPEIGLKVEPEPEVVEENPLFETPQSNETFFKSATTEETSKPIFPKVALPEEDLSIEMPDIEKVASTLGLPETMVKAFIKEFATTYINDISEVKAAMDSNNFHIVKKEAIKLKGIAANLRMDPLTSELEKVMETKNNDDVKEIWRSIDLYMQKLATIYVPELIPSVPTVTTVEESTVVPEEPAYEMPTQLSEVSVEENIESVEMTLNALKLEEKDTGESIIFDPNEAADALGLPESLILEFVNDFIEQAREEKATFEEAYDKGDIGTINEVAHKLKGVAANLRIEDMRQLMENVQHAKSPQEVEKELIDFYHKLAALTKMMAKEYA